MADTESRGNGARSGALGSLQSLGLAEIVQSLTLGRRTARITVTSGNRWGHIWIEDGQARHAQTGRMFGEFAFYEIVGWRTGQFLLEPDVRTEIRSLEHDPMYLVMEASRRIDEAEASDPAATTEAEALRTIPLKVTVSPAPAAPRAASDRPHAAGVVAGPRRTRDRRRRLLIGALVPLGAIGLVVGVRGMLEPDPARAVTRSRSLGEPVRPVAPLPSEDEAARDPIDEPEPDSETDAVERPEEAPPPQPAHPDPRASSIVDDRVETVPTAGSVTNELEATLPPVPEVAPAAVTETRAYLRLSGKSSVKAGTLVVRVDGAEVYVRTLTAKQGKTARFFKRMFGRAGEIFETVIPVDPGAHEVVAQVTIDGDSAGYDASLELDLDPGATQDLRLVAGRRLGRPLTLRAD